MFPVLKYFNVAISVRVKALLKSPLKNKQQQKTFGKHPKS